MFRMRIALFCSKLVYLLLRLMRRGASHLPGWAALQICPDYLSRIPKCPLTVCVTGTNGKTTVTHLIASALVDSGRRTVWNQSGSNIAPGVATALTNSVGWSGKPMADAVVLEVDERASRLILPGVKPDYLVVTNLFRDSLKRNANPDYIFSVIDAAIPAKTKLILNSDCLFSSRLGEDRNRRVFFAFEKTDGNRPEFDSLVEDGNFCPVCHSKLTYRYRFYHHIGSVVCDQCGFFSHPADYKACLTRDGARVTVTEGEDQREIPLFSSAVFNYYNEIAVVAALREIGLSMEEISRSFAGFTTVDTRLSETRAGGISVVQAMSKGQSCVSCSQTFNYLRRQEGRKAVVLMVDDWDDRHNTVEYVGWIYDADYELLRDESIVQIIAAGPRCLDHRLRLLLAGIDRERVDASISELAAPDLLRYEDVDAVYLLYDTSTLDQAMKAKGKILKKLSGSQTPAVV